MNAKRKYLAYKKRTTRTLKELREHKKNLKDYNLFYLENVIMKMHCKLLSKSDRYYRIRADFRYFKNNNGKFEQSSFKKSKAYKLRYS